MLSAVLTVAALALGAGVIAAYNAYTRTLVDLVSQRSTIAAIADVGGAQVYAQNGTVLFRSAALSSGLAAATVACGTAGKRAATSRPGTAVGTTQPKSGGTLTYAGGLGSFDLSGRSWDPQIQTQSGARSYWLFYDTLLTFDLVSYDAEPWLARSWEQPSETSYILHRTKRQMAEQATGERVRVHVLGDGFVMQWRARSPGAVVGSRYGQVGRRES